MCERVKPDVRHSLIQTDVRNFRDFAANRRKLRYMTVGQALISKLKLQVRYYRRKVRVSGTLAKTKDRSLYMRSSGVNRHQRVSNSEPRIVVRMNAYLRFSDKAADNSKNRLVNVERHCPALRVAKRHNRRTALNRRLKRFQSIFAVLLPAVKEMLRIKNNGTSPLFQKRDSLAYHV